jgi:hypothetical protein
LIGASPTLTLTSVPSTIARKHAPMSELDRQAVEAKIRESFGRERNWKIKGREMNTINSLIKIAAEVADRHYKEAGR